jgi:hypothetical protein
MDRPRLHVCGAEVPVRDLSEGAMRLDASAWHDLPRPGQRLTGSVRLAQGRVLEVKARCERLGDGEEAGDVVIVLDADARVPLDVIFEEQRVLRAKFRDWT